METKNTPIINGTIAKSPEKIEEIKAMMRRDLESGRYIRSLTQEELDIFGNTAMHVTTNIPAFTNVVSILNPMVDATAETCYVDKHGRLGLSYWFLYAIPPAMRYTWLAHEAMHVLNSHFTRAEAVGCNAQDMNITGDLEINTTLSTIHWTDLSVGILPEHYNFPNYKTLEVYNELLRQKRRDEAEAAQDGTGEKDSQQGDKNGNSGQQNSPQGGSQSNPQSSSESEQGQSGESSSSGDSNNSGQQGGSSQGSDSGSQSGSGQQSTQGEGQSDSQGQSGSQCQGDQQGNGSDPIEEAMKSYGKAVDNMVDRLGEDIANGGKSLHGGGDDARGDHQSGDQQSDGPQGDGSQGQSDSSQGQGDQQGDEEGNGPVQGHAHNADKNGQPNDHGGRACDQPTEERTAQADAAGIERTSDSAQEIARQDTRARIEGELNSTSSRTRSSSGVGNEFYSLMYSLMSPPKVDWRKIFRKVLANAFAETIAGRSRHSYSRVNRRYSNSRVIFPGMVDYVPSAMIGVDTSGSMGSDDYQAALNEIEAITTKVVRSRTGVPVFSVDTRVSNVKPVRSVRDLDLRGGGGTDMAVAFEYVKSLPVKKQPNIFILATDGYVDWHSLVKVTRDARFRSIILVTDADMSGVPQELHRYATVLPIGKDNSKNVRARY